MPTKFEPVYFGNYRSRGSAVSPWYDGSIAFSNRHDLIISHDHDSWRAYTGFGDSGGPFLSIHQTYEISPAILNSSRYQGPWVCSRATNTPLPSGLYAPAQRLDAELIPLGSTAIARSLPTNSVAETSVLIGETMREGIPQIIGSSAFKNQVHTAHKAGHEYLNIEFGWKPLVSSLKQFGHAVLKADDYMDGYVKHSRKKVRRRYLYPVEEATRSYETTTAVDGISPNMWTQADTTDSYERKTWFSGAFRYYVPDRDSNKFGYYRSEASKILGLELTPEVVWNLAPWSWAADWFSNTGDVLHNISRMGQDGLVMQYGYLMSQHSATRNIIAMGDSPDTRGATSYYKSTRTVKQRMPSTPYGFGLSYNGLSNKQKAIITALGLTRAF